MTKEQVKTIKEFHKLYDKVKEVFNNNYLIEDFQIEYYPYINISEEVKEG